MQRSNEQQIREELMQLQVQHRNLDVEIATLEASGTADQLHISRLKRQKLQLKDRITSLEDQLLPDIIA